MKEERQGISYRESKAKVCQEMKQTTLEKTAKLGIILTEKGISRSLRSESLFPPSQPS